MQQVLFGNLTLKKVKSNSFDFLNKYHPEIEHIFRDINKKLENLTVIEAERKIALENLRSLTKRLQSNRLKQKARVFCKYFSD